MKTIELEFEPGQECHIMVGSKPVSTRIRAYACTGSLEFSSDSKGEAKTERVRESVTYSTIAKPNDPMDGSKIGKSKEELMQKLFGHLGTGELGKSKTKAKDEPAQ